MKKILFLFSLFIFNIMSTESVSEKFVYNMNEPYEVVSGVIYFSKYDSSILEDLDKFDIFVYAYIVDGVKVYERDVSEFDGISFSSTVYNLNRLRKRHYFY